MLASVAITTLTDTNGKTGLLSCTYEQHKKHVCKWFINQTQSLQWLNQYCSSYRFTADLPLWDKQ